MNRSHSDHGWAGQDWSRRGWPRHDWPHRRGERPDGERPDGERSGSEGDGARRGNRIRIGAAVVIALIQVYGCRWAMRDQPGTAIDVLGYGLLLAGPAALIVRRRWPVAALVVAIAATVAFGLLDGYPGGPYEVAAIVALVVAVGSGRQVQAVLVAGTGWLVYVFAGRVVDDIAGRELRVPGAGQAVLLAVGIFALLAFAEMRRIGTAHARQQARMRRVTARVDDEQRRRKASEERLRIARELHDVIGHHLSLINVRAGVGLHLLDSQPEQAREALAAIKQTSAEALREVRSVLGAIDPDTGTAPRTPAPGLSRLDDLVAEVTAAGLPVRVDLTGERPSVPAEVDRAAFRIIQEALTNVRRHARPRPTVPLDATILILYAESALTVTVRDNGAPVESTVDGPDLSTVDGDDPGGGTGIDGMRERALALGGTFHAGPWSGSGPTAGGFEVTAFLPWEETA